MLKKLDNGKLYIGPSPNDPDNPGMSLRAHVNMSVKRTPWGAKVKCPYCGCKSNIRISPGGGIKHFNVYHEDWCPVPVDEDFLPARD